MCDNEELILNATSLTGGAITWDNGATNNVAFTPLIFGLITYTATSSDANDCFFSVDITVLESPIVTSTSTDEVLGSDGTGDFDDTEDLTGLLAGTHTVYVADSLGCIYTNPIVVNSQLGIDDTDNTNFSVFPNPTTDQIILKFKGAFTYQLTSVQGKVILEGNAINSEIISLNSLTNGTYFIKVNTVNSNKSLKVIKK